VYPAEVERVLGAHPDVAEVVVVPAPHDRWGQTVVAVVVPKPGTAPTLAELREFAAPSLGRFKLPTALRLVTMIPRTATGKISRREVIQALG
jgi:fatty-acyl-CoA synthase